MLVTDAGLFWASMEETEKPEWSWIFNEQRLVPLAHVHAEAMLVETTSEVKITQKYINRRSVPIEAIYVFPLDEHAAVCEFEAEIEGKKVVGVVKEKEQAKTEYNQAIRRGDGAYLLEQAKPDIFRAKVGNIPPGVEVTISIKYVSEMKCELEKVRFLLPTHVAPRYTPAYSPGEELFAPPTHQSAFAPYKLSVNVTAVSAAGFSVIESPSHKISTSIVENVASIGLDSGVDNLDKDFLVMLTYKNPHEPKVVLEDNGKGSYAAMVTLFPHLQFKDSKAELVFVIDRSGSMETKVKELSEAMQLFMSSLPVGCFFNIVGFGSSFIKLFPVSRPYDNESLRLAKEHLSTLKADLGGTELLLPLQDIFAQARIPGYSRQVFVLTDGQVTNTEQVLALVQRNKQARVFALGIGDSVSHHLVEGLARAGKGTSFFVMQNERMEKKILKQLKDATQPSLDDVKVNWGVNTDQPAGEPVGTKVLSLLSYVSPEADDQPTTFHQAPYTVPPVFNDTHFRVYAIFSSPKLPKKIVVEAMSPDGLLRVELPVSSEKVIKGNLLHTLGARSLIRDLEEGTSHLHSQGSGVSHLVKDEVTRLGIQYRLASKYTSFLAIEERSPEEKWFNCYGVGNQTPQYDAVSHIASQHYHSLAPPRDYYRSPQSNSYKRSPASYASISLSAAQETQSSACISAPAPSYSWPSFSFPSLFKRNAETPPPPPPPSAPTPVRSVSSSSSSSSNSTPAPPVTFAAAVPTSHMDLLVEILKLQDTRGTFVLSDRLANLLGVALEILQDRQKGLSGLFSSIPTAEVERIWATVVVLSFFKLRLPDLAQECEMVENKAHAWLTTQSVSNLPRLMTAADELFKK